MALPETLQASIDLGNRPGQEIVAVYHPSDERFYITKNNTLTGSNALPDFSVHITEIFE